MPTAADEPIAFIACDFAFALLMIGMCLCLNRKAENAEGRATQAQAHAQVAVAAAQATVVRRMTAAAQVVKLRYFPYSTVGRRSSEKLVCTICLDGEACGEVPACRHFFHRACVDLWKESSVTCPLCRGYMGEMKL